MNKEVKKEGTPISFFNIINLPSIETLEVFFPRGKEDHVEPIIASML